MKKTKELFYYLMIIIGIMIVLFIEFKTREYGKRTFKAMPGYIIVNISYFLLGYLIFGYRKLKNLKIKSILFGIVFIGLTMVVLFNGYIFLMKYIGVIDIVKFLNIFYLIFGAIFGNR